MGIIKNLKLFRILFILCFIAQVVVIRVMIDNSFMGLVAIQSSLEGVYAYQNILMMAIIFIMLLVNILMLSIFMTAAYIMKVKDTKLKMDNIIIGYKLYFTRFAKYNSDEELITWVNNKLKK